MNINQQLKNMKKKDVENLTYKPPYIKLKIDVNFETGRPKITLYNRANGVREIVIVDKFKDVTDSLRYMSKVRFIICIDKLYLMKSWADNKKKYGIGIKIIAAEYENKSKPVLERTDVNFVDFVD